MKPDHFRSVLQSLIDDQRLSRSDRRALSALLDQHPPSDAQRAELRHLAFDVAREELVDAPQAAPVLGWLEDVVKLLLPTVEERSSGCAGDVCFSPGEACRDRIAGLFRTARTAVDVCVFTITDNVISQEIVDAHRRGVAVRIISDDQKQFDTGSDIHRFTSVGIPVRVDRTRHHMHHKFAIFDQTRVVTGSYNWTTGAAFDNEEHIVILGEPQLIARFEREFEKLWKAYA